MRCQPLDFMFPAVAADLFGHWLVTGALLWPFIVGVFPFCKAGENWPAVTLTHASAWAVQLLGFTTWCVLTESGWSAQSAVFPFLCAVFFGWFTEGFHLPAVRGECRAHPLPGVRKHCPSWGSLEFSFFAEVSSWISVLRRSFWRGRNDLGNLCRLAFSFREVIP